MCRAIPYHVKSNRQVFDLPDHFLLENDFFSFLLNINKFIFSFILKTRFWN